MTGCDWWTDDAVQASHSFFCFCLANTLGKKTTRDSSFPVILVEKLFSCDKSKKLQAAIKQDRAEKATSSLPILAAAKETDAEALIQSV